METKLDGFLRHTRTVFLAGLWLLACLASSPRVPARLRGEGVL